MIFQRSTPSILGSTPNRLLEMSQNQPVFKVHLIKTTHQMIFGNETLNKGIY